jgi:hypothetical protein
MDRSRYYSPEELYNSALRFSSYGLSVEIVSRQYQKIKNNIELLFACKVVSIYHVSLHDDNEMDVRCHTEASFMDTTTDTIANYHNTDTTDAVDSIDNTIIDMDNDNGNEDILGRYSPVSPNYTNVFDVDDGELSPWNDLTTKFISTKRDRRNMNRNKFQNDITPHAEIIQESQDSFVTNDSMNDIIFQ